MEYRKTTPAVYIPKVKDIQVMLNNARVKALMLVREDFSKPRLLQNSYYFQVIHHRDDVSNEWKVIDVDGKFGDNTECAVKGLQRFLFISENGIMGDYTYSMMQKLLSAQTQNGSILYGETTRTKHTEKSNAAALFVEALFKGWNEIAPLSQGLLFIMGNGCIIFADKTNNLTLHVNWTQIIKEYLLGSKHKNVLLFRVNHKSTFRQFKAYNISKAALNISSKLSGIMRGFSLVGLAFDIMDVRGKIYKGEFRFCDLTKPVFNSVNVGLDIALANVKTVGVPLSKTVSNYGKAVVKWKHAAKIVGTGTASVTATGLVVIGIQCVGAFMTGYELGKWIEKKTHIGEAAMDFCWELFLGDIIEKVAEWKVNRVMCVKYPNDWTESDIQKFNEKFK